MKEEVDALQLLFDKELQQAATLEALQNVRVHFLGKKSPLQALMKQLKDFNPQERQEAGRWLNLLKDRIENDLNARHEALLAAHQEEQIKLECLDVTLPARHLPQGGAHPVLAMLDEVSTILAEMGFSIQQGPHIESDYYNFEALNYPKDHPARDMQDTFYLSDDLLLRTHNTSIQVRLMENTTPPIRIICPGKCFRNEEVNARCHLFFHQVDGLYIDKNVSFADLLATLEEFLKRLFGNKVETRFRPSYFPFVEPGLEADVTCLACEGKGCSVCKHSGWLEILGAGMIHPEVLRTGGIDPEIYSGFAWGMGIERLVMIKHRIRDIRLFSQNDMRFLAQF